MTQENNLFKPIDQSLSLDPNTDFLAELVGDNKKFKDAQALAKGKAEADLYVKTLEQKLDEMRGDYEEARKQNMAGARLEELITKLNSKQSDSETNPPAKDEENTPQFKPEDIEKIVLSKIEDAKRQDRDNNNLRIVEAKLKERYGQNSTSILEHQSQTLGLTQDDVNALAKKSPEAFFRTFGLDQQQQDSFQSPPRNQIRNDSFSPNVPKRTWSYYQDIKKKDKALYYSPKIIAQMHRDHAELGQTFEDGDYNS